MATLRFTELCTRWADELDRPREDLARELIENLLGEDDDPARLKWRLPELLANGEELGRQDYLRRDAELDHVIQHLREVINNGTEPPWQTLESVIIERDELQRWVDDHASLPRPTFWQSRVKRQDEQPEEERETEQLGDKVPSRTVLLKILACTTMALAESKAGFWTNGTLTVQRVVETTLDFLERHPDVQFELGEKGLSKTRIQDAYRAAENIAGWSRRKPT
jgi:hypothetical protein